AAELNHQTSPDDVLIRRSTDGRLCIGEEQLKRWRLKRPPGHCEGLNGESFYQLSSITGLQWTLDEQALTLKLQAPAQAFEGYALKASKPVNPQPQPSPLGGFLNYDLLAQQVDAKSGVQRSGLFELGVFGSNRGVLTQSLLSNTRLDSTWTRDSPESRTTWQVGDAVTRSASGWGRSVRFGGIQFATNAATQPYTNYYPTQTIRGEAIMPSTVDVMMNNKLVSSHDVPPGPFALNELTTLSGGGAMQVIVRDLLGRERVVSQPYYASPTALAAGIEEYAYEAGAIREDYGLANNHYGRHLIAGTYRRVNSAWSRSGQGDGQLIGFGFERNLVGGFGFSASTQRSSALFTQLGLAPTELAPRRVQSASLSYFGGRYGSINLGVIARETQSHERSELISANYQLNIQNRATLSVSGVANVAGTPTRGLFFLLAIPLGGRVSSAISAQHASGDSRSTQEFALQAQQNPAPGDGFGWQVRTTSQGAQQAGAVLDRHDGTYRVDLARSASQDLSVRAVASGGLALIGGSLQRGSRINDSFALVQLPDYPGVRVYADNQPVGRTDAQGNAFIPRLRSYEVNRIGVNQLDLPLDAKVDAVTVNATPYYRSGIVVRFPVTESKGAMIRVLFDDDLPAPVGATLVLNQQPEPFTVVMDGMAYLTGLSRKNQLELTWRSHRCRIAVLMPPSNDPLPDLGTFTCRGVPR
ncbi:MAG: fimbrial biogenesis outer membrane usher protein, partial [Betaproteobacteria bacterium]|nr:fimbrial biogenesis outer membrane usher protein [Betaproteobacteria bacterium]